MKKKYELIDYFLIFAIIFFMLVGSMNVFGQTIEGKGFIISKMTDDSMSIVFDDGSRDKLYQNTDDGVKLVYQPKGTLLLTPKEYKQFVKDCKRASKNLILGIELERDKYIINSYSWSDDSIYFLVLENNRVGEIFLNDIKKL